MRFRDYAPATLLISAIFTVVAPPASAQFREILPEGPEPDAPAIDLIPTSEPFIPPPVDESPPEPADEAEETAKDAPEPREPEEVTAPASPPDEPVHKTTAGSAQPDDGKDVATKDKDEDHGGKGSELGDEPSAGSEGADDIAAEGVESVEESIENVDPFAAFKTQPDGGLDAPSPSDRPHYAPLGFNGVEPGASTLDHLKSQWGSPAKQVKDGKSQILVYQVPGFQQVDVFSDADGAKVESILIHLAAPTDAVELQTELGLADYDPVVIPDAKGTPLAQAFPERGVLFTYDVESKSEIISQISLESIQGELFRLRAEHDFKHQDSRCLKDLEQATRLNSEDHYAYWLQAELLSSVGRSQDALASVRVATRIEPKNALYRLTLARLLASNGELDEGLRITQSILDDPHAATIVRARAEYQMGNLKAIGPEPAYEDALTHHMKAIDLAVKHVGDERTSVRRMSKDILVDAHLAIAQDIALGNFQRKRDVVPKWLTRAAQLGEDFISRDTGDETIRMEIYRSTLAIYSVLEGNFDPSIAAEEALNEGRRLIAQADDLMYQARVERELSEALLHASKVEHRRGRAASAMTYASNAVALLEGQHESRQPSLFDRIMEGQLYFLLGSLYAVNRDDHQEAVVWYERAKPMFDDEALTNLVDSSSFGDLFVSMGVSYWEAGKKEKAVQMSQIGAELMQQAVQAGSLDLAALAVPYGNLAAMHKNLGNPSEAKHFAEMMAKVEKTATQQR